MNLYLVIAASIILTSSRAQKDLFKNYSGSSLWLGYYPGIGISSKFTLNSDIQYRNSQPFSAPFLFLVRTGLVYKLKDNISTSIGYALFSNVLTTHELKKENRIWQEVCIKNRSNSFRFSNRIRSEQRFFESTENNKAAYFKQLINRIRWKIELKIPLSKASESYSLVLSNEIMFASRNLTNWFFDQNRLAIGANIKLSKQTYLSPQFLYLLQSTNNKITNTTIARLNILQKF